MAKKDLFDELNAVKKEMQQRQGSKAHPEVTPEELKRRKAEGKTRGAKGAKADRINMAFTTDNFDYIRIMAGIRGQTMTAFVNDVIAEHRTEHPEQFEQARAIIESMKK